MEKAQEKENLKQLSLAERNEQKKLAGNLKPSEKEYHIYKLKQELYKAPDIPEKPARGVGESDIFDEVFDL